MKTLTIRHQLATIIQTINDLNVGIKYHYDAGCKNLYAWSKEQNAYLFESSINKLTIKFIKIDLIEMYKSLAQES